MPKAQTDKQPGMTRRRLVALFFVFTMFTGLFVGAPSSTPVAGAYPLGDGYWLAATDGGMFSFGDAQFYGSMGDQRLNAPVVGMAAHPFLEGYWLVATDGGVFSFGSSGFFGSTGDIKLVSPIVGIAPSHTGLGYYLVAADGGVFAFGDAVFRGSMGGQRLNKPIVGMAVTPSGNGYWLVATDGGLFSFGDAEYQGSQGGKPLNKPIVGMAPSPSGKGYYMVASDGGIFTFGDAFFRGSRGGEHLNAPIVGMAVSPDGAGYQFVATDGGIFNYGDSKFFGSTGSMKLNKPILGMALRPRLAVKADAFGTSVGSQSSSWVDVAGDWRLRLNYQSGDTPAGARIYGVEGLDADQLGTMTMAFDSGTCTSATRFTVYYDTNGDRVGDANKAVACSGGTAMDAGVPAKAIVTSLDITHTGGPVDVDNIVVGGITITDYNTFRAAS